MKTLTRQPVFFTTKQAGELLGVTDARVRQLCIANGNIGKKHGNAWILSTHDIEQIRNLPEFRKKPAC